MPDEFFPSIRVSFPGHVQFPSFEHTVRFFEIFLAGTSHDTCVKDTAIGLLLTPVGVLYSDIGKGLPLLMQFLIYLTPVVFPMPKAGIAATMYALNPLPPVILTARDWLTGMPGDSLSGFLLINIVVLVKSHENDVPSFANRCFCDV